MRTATTAALLVLLIPARGVGQVERSVDVRVVDGLARIHLTLSFDGEDGASASLLEPIPEGAGLAGLRVCRAAACRRGRVDHGAPPALDGRPGAPSAWASHEGDGLRVTVGPLSSRAPTVVSIRMTVPTSLTDGRDGITLPAREGPTRVRLRAPFLREPRIGEADARGWRDVEAGPIRLDAALPPGAIRAVAHATSCGDRRCLRYRVATAPLEGAGRDVFLLVDASPSARAADPALRAQALDRLLSSLPAGSTVRRVAYAWRARRIDHVPLDPAQIPRDMPIPSDLGPATRVSGAWALLDGEIQSARRPLVLLFGDGTLGYWTTERQALDAMVTAGAEVHAVDMVGRRSTSTLEAAVLRSGGMDVEVVQPRQLADLDFLARPVVLPALHIGDERFHALRAGQELSVNRIAEGLPAVLRTDHLTRRPQGIARPWDAGLAVALSRQGNRRDPRMRLRAVPPPRQTPRGRRLSRLAPPPVPQIRVAACRVMGGLSREATNRVRRSFRPRVRACFQAMRRRGRRDRVRARLEMIFEHGEVAWSGAQVDDPELARCLADVPALVGRIPEPEGGSRYRLNMPYLSRAIPTAPTLPLDDDVARLVDTL